MKKIIFSIVVMALVMGSCKQNSTDNGSNHSNHMNDDNMMMDNDSTMMHNNSHNMNDGSMMMDNDTIMMQNKSNTMQNHEKMYACSMHPEIMGKMDENCSKCGMKLTEPILKKK